MKIAINTTSTVAGGGVTYIKNLLTYLSKIDATHQYLILTTLAGKETFYFQHPNFIFLPFKLPSISSISRLCWEQVFLPIFLKRKNVDILFSPANMCPLFTRLPNVVTIQNIEPFSNTVSKGRGFIQNVRLKLLKFLTSLSIKKSQIVIFPSTKARIDAEKSGIVIKRSEVVYHGINKEIFYPRNEDEMSQQCAKKYGLDKFILYVSHIQRYKNFLELIKAFVLLRGKIDDNIQLVFAGRCFDEEYYKEMEAFIKENRYENQIIFLGNVPYEELPFLYSACKIFVYPSTCESFGMTLVEAMACGAPILASRMEPMTEICADAAFYFDPINPAAIAVAMDTILKDHHRISVMSEKAQERAKIFSWENTVLNTLKVLESVTQNARLAP